MDGSGSGGVDAVIDVLFGSLAAAYRDIATNNATPTIGGGDSKKHVERSVRAAYSTRSAL